LESGFPGELYPINPKADEILGYKAYPNLSALPEIPDLTIICLSAPHVPGVLDECARIGLRHIHILSSGFKELGTPEGKELEEKVSAIAKANGLLVMGPNCMGPYCPASKLTAWGAIPGQTGPLGIISQSGGITQRLTEYACFLGIGVEKAVSIGNSTVLNELDFLESMAGDPGIKLIAMYMEGVREGRKFLRLAKDVSQKKPIVLLKGGQTSTGALSAASHTGAIAGDQSSWEAFYRQSGVVRVKTMDEWLDAIMAFTFLPPPEGREVFIIGGGGGNSVIYSDTCINEGLRVPLLSEFSAVWLRNNSPSVGSIAGNPLDVWQTFTDPDYLGDVLQLAFEDPNISMIIVDRLIPRKAFHMPEPPDTTPKIVELVKKNQGRKPLVFFVDSEGGDPDLAGKGAALRAAFGRAGIPAYPSMKRAARALVHLHKYHSRAG